LGLTSKGKNNGLAFLICSPKAGVKESILQLTGLSIKDRSVIVEPQQTAKFVKKIVPKDQRVKQKRSQDKEVDDEVQSKPVSDLNMSNKSFKPVSSASSASSQPSTNSTKHTHKKFDADGVSVASPTNAATTYVVSVDTQPTKKQKLVPAQSTIVQSSPISATPSMTSTTSAAGAQSEAPKLSRKERKKQNKLNDNKNNNNNNNNNIEAASENTSKQSVQGTPNNNKTGTSDGHAKMNVAVVVSSSSNFPAHSVSDSVPANDETVRKPLTEAEKLARKERQKNAKKAAAAAQLAQSSTSVSSTQTNQTDRMLKVVKPDEARDFSTKHANSSANSSAKPKPSNQINNEQDKANPTQRHLQMQIPGKPSQPAVAEGVRELTDAEKAERKARQKAAKAEKLKQLLAAGF
jgi:hypothetical protein